MKQIFLFIFFVAISSIAIMSCDRPNIGKSLEEADPASEVRSDSSSASSRSTDSVDTSRTAKLACDTKKMQETLQILKDSIGQLGAAKDSLAQETNRLDENQNNIVRNALPYLLIFILLVLDIFLFIRLNRHKRKLKELNVCLRNLPMDNNTVSPGVQRYVANRENTLVKEINRAIDNQQKEIKKMQGFIQTFTTSTLPEKEMVSENPVAGSVRKIYMRKPSSEKTFDASSELKDDREEAYYIFTIDYNNPNRAEFEFTPYDDRHMNKAYENRTDTINTVCDAQYNNNGTPKSCQTTKPGIAEKIGGEWKVVTKAKVIYN